MVSNIGKYKFNVKKKQKKGYDVSLVKTSKTLIKLSTSCPCFQRRI